MSHPPSAEGIVLVDFDGTLFPWGSLSAQHAPFANAATAMHALVDAGYSPVIFTSRLSPSWHTAEGRDPAIGCAEQRAIIERALFQNDIPFFEITAEKIPAELYLDDKAMRVNAGRDLLAAVTAFLEMGDEAV